MTKHSVYDARRNLSALIDRAAKGERVVITIRGKPVVELRPALARRRPPPGFAAEARRQSRLLAGSPNAEEDQAFVDAIQEFTSE
jgi:prevent-host-death family protein